MLYGEPRARLVDLVVSPWEYLSNRRHRRLNATYYIVKQIIPSLARLLNLIGRAKTLCCISGPWLTPRATTLGSAGADVAHWFQTMKKPQARRLRPPTNPAAARTTHVQPARRHPTLGLVASSSVRTIESFYLNEDCAICGELCKGGVCDTCASNPQQLACAVAQRSRVASKLYEVGHGLNALCSSGLLCAHHRVTESHGHVPKLQRPGRALSRSLCLNGLPHHVSATASTRPMGRRASHPSYRGSASGQRRDMWRGSDPQPSRSTQRRSC